MEPVGSPVRGSFFVSAHKPVRLIFYFKAVPFFRPLQTLERDNDSPGTYRIGPPTPPNHANDDKKSPKWGWGGHWAGLGEGGWGKGGGVGWGVGVGWTLGVPWEGRGGEESGGEGRGNVHFPRQNRAQANQRQSRLARQLLLALVVGARLSVHAGPVGMSGWSIRSSSRV